MSPVTILLAVLAALAAAAAPVLADECPCLDAPRDPVCGSDGTTYPSRCALDCARASAHAGPLLAHAGPCTASATWNLAGLTKCTTACSESFSKCVLPCDDHACLKGCLQLYAVDCYCDCRRYLNGTSPATDAQQGFALEGVLLPAFLAATPSPDQEDAQELGHCFSSNLTDVQDCSTRCKASDDGCLASCYLTSYDRICECSVEGHAASVTPASTTSTPGQPVSTASTSSQPPSTASDEPTTDYPVNNQDSEFYMCYVGCLAQYEDCVQWHCNRAHMTAEELQACTERCYNVFPIDNKVASCMCRCGQFPHAPDFSRTPRLLLAAAADNTSATTPFQTCVQDTQSTVSACHAGCNAAVSCQVDCVVAAAAGFCTCSSAAGGLAAFTGMVALAAAAVLAWPRV